MPFIRCSRTYNRWYCWWYTGAVVSHSHRGDRPALTEETQIRWAQWRCGGGDVGTSSKTITPVYECVPMCHCSGRLQWAEAWRPKERIKESELILFLLYIMKVRLRAYNNLSLSLPPPHSLVLFLSPQAQPPPPDSEGYSRVNRSSVRSAQSVYTIPHIQQKWHMNTWKNVQCTYFLYNYSYTGCWGTNLRWSGPQLRQCT